MKFSKFVNEEFTVFIRVKIDNLKDVSLLIPETVRNNDKILREITNITTDKKYLLKSSLSRWKLKNGSLFEYTFLGLACDTTSLIENLKSRKILENLRPELVEKKDPPIIIRIIKMKVRFSGTSNENPIFDIELQIDKKRIEKLLL